MLLHPLILMFILHTCVVCDKPCGLDPVSAAGGGGIILRVPQMEIKVISWILVSEGNVIITTKPGKSIDDDEVIKGYRGRVRSEADGSLHINNLSLKDQGVYKADIRTGGDDICVQFNLTVYEKLSPGDIKINHSLTRNDNCSLSLLCIVDKQDVTITWSTAQSSHINVTQDVLYVPPSDVNFTYTCTARNPVSNVSKTVIPGEYCRKGDSNSSILGRRSHYEWILPIVIIIITLPAVLCYIWYKKRKSQKAEMTLTEVTTTEYAEVGGLQRQQENPYHQSQGEEQKSGTVYSEVKHVKKTTNSPKKLAENKTNPVETVYSTVSLPKETTNSEKKLAEKEANPVETVYSRVSLPKA